MLQDLLLVCRAQCTAVRRFMNQNFAKNRAQWVEVILNEIPNNINKNYTRLISALQGFQKCIA